MAPKPHDTKPHENESTQGGELSESMAIYEAMDFSLSAVVLSESAPPASKQKRASKKRGTKGGNLGNLGSLDEDHEVNDNSDVEFDEDDEGKLNMSDEEEHNNNDSMAIYNVFDYSMSAVSSDLKEDAESKPSARRSSAARRTSGLSKDVLQAARKRASRAGSQIKQQRPAIRRNSIGSVRDLGSSEDKTEDNNAKPETQNEEKEDRTMLSPVSSKSPSQRTRLRQSTHMRKRRPTLGFGEGEKKDNDERDPLKSPGKSPANQRRTRRASTASSPRPVLKRSKSLGSVRDLEQHEKQKEQEQAEDPLKSPASCSTHRRTRGGTRSVRRQTLQQGIDVNRQMIGLVMEAKEQEAADEQAQMVLNRLKLSSLRNDFTNANAKASTHESAAAQRLGGLLADDLSSGDDGDDFAQDAPKGTKSAFQSLSQQVANVGLPSMKGLKSKFRRSGSNVE